MDGASRLQVLLKVIGPMCKPLIAVIAIQSFQGAWNDYLTPLLYVISKPEKWTLSLAVGRMTSSTYGTQWNLFMAADVVYMLPILNFVLLLSEVLHGRPWLFKQFRRKSLNVFEDCGSAKHVAIWYQRGQNTF